MIYRYLYKITCTAGSFKNKYYIGKHTTYNLNDGYKGSGRFIKDYYKKYPDDYIKEIICYCNSDEELDMFEKCYIALYIDDSNCLNIASGGTGGFTGYHNEQIRLKMKEAAKHKPPMSEETKRKISNSHKGILNSPETRKKISEACKGRKAWNKGLKGVSAETSKKMSEAKKGFIPWNKGIKMK